MFLLDTNVISEIRKIHKGRADKGITAWFLSKPLDVLWLNDIVLLEVKQGALLAQLKKDPVQARILNFWVDSELPKQFDNRILPITQEICLLAATLHVPNQRDRHDALIAATALSHDLTLVTRNERDFVGIGGLKLFNPFTKKPQCI